MTTTSHIQDEEAGPLNPQGGAWGVPDDDADSVPSGGLLIPTDVRRRLSGVQPCRLANTWTSPDAGRTRRATLLPEMPGEEDEEKSSEETWTASSDSNLVKNSNDHDNGTQGNHFSVGTRRAFEWACSSVGIEEQSEEDEDEKRVSDISNAFL